MPAPAHDPDAYPPALRGFEDATPVHVRCPLQIAGSAQSAAFRQTSRSCPESARRDYLRTRNRRMVTSPDRVLLTGSRSILGRPRGEKRVPSPSSTGSRYTKISSTSPRRKHWPATSAPRISRFLPPAALRAVATASPMSPVRNLSAGSGGSGGLWLRTNTGPDHPPPYSLPPSSTACL